MRTVHNSTPPPLPPDYKIVLTYGGIFNILIAYI